MNNVPLTLDILGPQDRTYATNSSRFAFDHARFAAMDAAEGNNKRAAFHKREVIRHADFLVAGLTRIAKSLNIA